MLVGAPRFELGTPCTPWNPPVQQRATVCDAVHTSKPMIYGIRTHACNLIAFHYDAGRRGKKGPLWDHSQALHG